MSQLHDPDRILRRYRNGVVRRAGVRQNDFTTDWRNCGERVLDCRRDVLLFVQRLDEHRYDRRLVRSIRRKARRGRGFGSFRLMHDTADNGHETLHRYCLNCRPNDDCRCRVGSVPDGLSGRVRIRLARDILHPDRSPGMTNGRAAPSRNPGNRRRASRRSRATPCSGSSVPAVSRPRMFPDGIRSALSSSLSVGTRRA